MMLLTAFALIAIVERIGFGTSEKGAHLLWLPVFLAAYVTVLNKKNALIYAISCLALFYSNKKTSLMAFIFSLKSKAFYLVASLVFALSFIFRGNINIFIEKSLIARLAFWQSIAEGIMDKPFLGHGFGTFAIDFPVYRLSQDLAPAKANMLVHHGHSQIMHSLFEFGIIGFLLLALLFFLIYKNAPRIMMPILIISTFDTAFFNYNQMLLASLILLPLMKDLGPFTWIFKPASGKKGLVLYLSSILITSSIMLPSVIGHFYYSKGDLDNAIKWDPKHSFYHFMRGTKYLKIDSKKSEVDYLKAVELSPSVSYFYGFLAASQLSNFKLEEANISIDKAIKFDGENGYWYYLKGMINYKDKATREVYIKRGLEISPEIYYLINKPESIKLKKTHFYIGQVAFFRRGSQISLPAPYPIYRQDSTHK